MTVEEIWYAEKNADQVHPEILQCEQLLDLLALRETAGFYLGKCNVKVVSWLAWLSTLTRPP